MRMGVKKSAKYLIRRVCIKEGRERKQKEDFKESSETGC